MERYAANIYIYYKQTLAELFTKQLCRY